MVTVNSGSGTLTATAPNGISLNNASGNHAATVSLTNGPLASGGNIVYNSNQAFGVTANNMFANGTINIANYTGMMTVNAGGLATAGTTTANITISSAGGITQTGDIAAAGTGIVSINASAPGMTQTGKITGSGLDLTGAGNYTLTKTTNDVDTIAGSVTGSVTYIDADDLEVKSTGTSTTLASTGGGNILLAAGTSNAGDKLAITNAVTTTGGSGTGNISLYAGNGIAEAANVSATVSGGTNAVTLYAGYNYQTLAQVSTGAITSAGGIVTGAAVTLRAATGIGVVGGTHIATAADALTAETHAAGGIAIAEANAITLSSVVANDGAIDITAGGTITATAVSVTTPSAANDIAITASAGDIAVGIIGAGSTGGITLSATAGSVTDNNATATADLTCNDLSITALHSIGAAGDSLDTAVASISLSSTGTTLTNDIYILEADTVTVSALSHGTSAGDVSITTTDGTVTLANAATKSGSGSTTITAGGTTRDIYLNAVINGGSGNIVLNATKNIYLGSTAAADITTTAGTITFQTPVVLSAATVITRGAGAVTFSSTLDSTASQPYTLTIDGASGGDVTFSNAVGSGTDQQLGAILISTGATVLASSSIKAASFVQSAGTTTTLSGNVTTTDALGVNITAGTINLAGIAIDTSSGTGGVRCNGATVLSAATAATTTITRGTGDVTFTSTLDSATSIGNALTINGASGGNVTFSGAVGGGTDQQLGAILISTGTTVLASSTISAASFVQSAGTTTTLSGNVTTTAAAGVDITAGTINLAGITIDTSSGNGAVRCAGATVLSAATTATTTITRGTGAVNFTSTLRSATSAANALTINGASGGSVTFSNAVGSGLNQQLGAILISTGTAIAFSDTVTSSSDLTIHCTDLSFGGAVNISSTGTLSIFSNTGDETIGIGSLVAGVDIQISQTTIDYIRQAKTILIGDPTIQSGLITFKNATFHNTITGLTDITVSSYHALGTGIKQIHLDDSGTGAALDVNNAGVTLTLNTGTGGLTANVSNDTCASISNASTTILSNASGGTANEGTNTNAIKFSNTSGAVRINNTNGSGTVYLRGLGNLTVNGGAASATGDRTLVIETIAGGNLTISQTLGTGTGDITLSPAGSLYLDQSVTTTTGSITLSPTGSVYLNYAAPAFVVSQTTGDLTVSRPVILQANAAIRQTTGSSSNRILFDTGATIDSPSTAHNLTVTGVGNDVTFTEAIGATNPLASFTVTSDATISMANIGNTGTPAAGAATVSATASTTGAISYTGTYYRTTGAQSWVAGDSGTPHTLTANHAAEWYAGATLTIHGNFMSTMGNATLRSADIDLGNFGSWTMTGRTLNLYTVTGGTAMNVGTLGAGGWELSDTEILRLNVAGPRRDGDRVRRNNRAVRSDNLPDRRFLHGEPASNRLQRQERRNGYSQHQRQHRRIARDRIRQHHAQRLRHHLGRAASGGGIDKQRSFHYRIDQPQHGRGGGNAHRTGTARRLPVHRCSGNLLSDRYKRGSFRRQRKRKQREWCLAHGQRRDDRSRNGIDVGKRDDRPVQQHRPDLFDAERIKRRATRLL